MIRVIQTVIKSIIFLVARFGAQFIKIIDFNSFCYFTVNIEAVFVIKKYLCNYLFIYLFSEIKMISLFEAVKSGRVEGTDFRQN